MKKLRHAINRYNMLRPWTAKQYHWKSEAKEDHRLNPAGLSNRRKNFRSQPTKMHSFRSGQSQSLMPDPLASNERGQQSYQP